MNSMVVFQILLIMISNLMADGAIVIAVSKKYGLTKDERRLLHDMIGKQGNGYSELEELAREIKDMRK